MRDEPLVRSTAAGTTLQGEFPLSFQQEQLWFLHQLQPGQTTYNLPTALMLHGELDVEALRTALSRVVERQAALRTTFAPRGTGAVQVVAPPGPVDLPVTILPPTEGEARQVLAKETIEAESRHVFDLEKGPLFRPWLFQLAPDDHLLSLLAHHTCSDGWSTGVLVKELLEYYMAIRQGRAATLPDLPLQYAEYAVDQRERLRDAALDKELQYWEDTLSGAPVLDFPTDRARPAVPSYRGETAKYTLPSEVVDPMRALARDHRASLFMALLTGFKMMMVRYTGQEDVVLGTASAQREQPEIASLVGFFTNMMVLRSDLGGDPTFEQALERIRDLTLDVYEHQEVPFEKVVERVAPHRDPSRNPLFQIAIGLLPGQLAADFEERVGDLVVGEVLPDAGAARFDIAINMQENGHELVMWWEYATDLFDRARMDRMVGHFAQILKAAGRDPSLRLSQLPMLTDDERQKVLVDWQGGQREYLLDPVHRQILDQAARTPDTLAAKHRDESLTYAELARRSGHVAAYLQGEGVGHGDVVAIAVGRGLDVPACVLGVLRTGAAYLPIDLSHPADRIGFMLADAATKIVLTTSAQVDRLPQGDWRTATVDRIAMDGPADTDSAGPATPRSAAYVLYTSGSTGRPKGVVIEHHALATFVDWMGTLFGIGPGLRMLQYAPLIFDLSEGEIFTGLTHGATLVFVPDEAMVSPEELVNLIRRERIQYMGAPPALITLLESEPYPDLRSILVGGEPFSGDLVNRWNLPDRLFVNGYGPTEVTIGCSYYPCDHKTWTGSPPIGRAMPNRRAYLVDPWLNPVPVGVPGEILAAGAGLARGYLDRPGLTAEMFIPDPFSDGGRAYRTGDLGYWTEDGQIQFIGRIDTQVKLRGQRIELEEIETVLTQHPDVRQAVVALRDDTPGGQGLVAYVVPGDDEPTPRDLRDHAARQVPGYMIPVAYVMVGGLPLHATGKVNRSALPAPESFDFVSSVYVAPSTPAEEQVAAAFAEVLGVERAGVEDSFFDLGGSSLQAALVLGRIRDNTGVALPMRHFYTQPTVQAIAAALDAVQSGTAESEDTIVVPLRAEGGRTPLFCVHNVSGSAYTYLPLAQLLPDDQPVYALQSPAADGGGTAHEDMTLVARQYVEAVRRVQPDGPYLLVGHSLGGTVVYEMATQLAEAGERVELLALLDTQVPLLEEGGLAKILQLLVDDLAGVAGRTAPRLDPAMAETGDVDWLTDQLRGAGIVPPDTGPAFVQDRLPAFVANVRAQWGYMPARPYPGRLTLLQAAESHETSDGWRAWCAELEHHVVGGNHYSMWEQPNLAGLAEVISGLLERTRSQLSPGATGAT